MLSWTSAASLGCCCAGFKPWHGQSYSCRAPGCLSSTLLARGFSAISIDPNGLFPSLVASQQHHNIPHPLLLGCCSDGDEGKCIIQQPLPAKAPEHHLTKEEGPVPGVLRAPTATLGSEGPVWSQLSQREQNTEAILPGVQRAPAQLFFSFHHFPDIGAVSHFKSQLTRALCPCPPRALAGQLLQSRAPSGFAATALEKRRWSRAGPSQGQLCRPAIPKYQGAH